MDELKLEKKNSDDDFKIIDNNFDEKNEKIINLKDQEEIYEKNMKERNKKFEKFEIKELSGTHYFPEFFTKEEQEQIFKDCKEEIFKNRR
jgi:hypothetical protein